MPLTKEQEEKLREEWLQHVGSDCGRIHTPDEKNIVVANLADFWLSKINEALEAQRKEIVEGIKGRIMSEIDFAMYHASHNIVDVFARESYARRVESDILSLPQLTGKKNEDEAKKN